MYVTRVFWEAECTSPAFSGRPSVRHRRSAGSPCLGKPGSPGSRVTAGPSSPPGPWRHASRRQFSPPAVSLQGLRLPVIGERPKVSPKHKMQQSLVSPPLASTAPARAIPSQLPGSSPAAPWLPSTALGQLPHSSLAAPTSLPGRPGSS